MNMDAKHDGQHKECRKCRGGEKVYPSVLCRLCVRPEGGSPFHRVGKSAVQHGNCAAAWKKEDVEKGHKHLLDLQIKKAEAELEAQNDALPEATPAQ